MSPSDGAGDPIRAMQELVQRTWTPGSRWHVGDVAWGWRAVPGADEGFRTRLWSEAGEVVGWGWAEPPGHLEWAVDPVMPGVAAEVLAWFDVVAATSERTVTILGPETHLADALDAAGYAPDLDAPFFTHHHLDLADLADLTAPSPPDGYRLRHVGPGDEARRAAVHRDSWSEFGSSVSTDSYGEVMRSWPYRPDLDWVVQAPDGTWVASALGWLDDHNRVGLLEPVGCAPAYRRRGLARAANLAVLHAFREAGATSALVGPRGDDGYPVAGKLYRSIGFERGASTVTYRPSTSHRAPAVAERT